MTGDDEVASDGDVVFKEVISPSVRKDPMDGQRMKWWLD